LFNHEENRQNIIKGIIGINVKQSHQTSFEQASLEEGEKQLTPFNTKLKKCTHIVEVEEDPNGRH
jgi:hypothetical protein